MKKPDAVFRELGQLYDFQKGISRFRFRSQERSNRESVSDGKSSTESSQRNSRAAKRSTRQKNKPS